MSDREIVVVMRSSQAGLEATGESPVPSASSADLARILGTYNATLRPLFDAGPETLPPGLEAMESPESAAIATEMERYYAIDVDDADANRLVEDLRGSELVETAYIKPATELPIAPDVNIRPDSSGRFPPFLQGDLARRTPGADTDIELPDAQRRAPAPDFRSRQTYLNAAPAGVDAIFGWTIAGGKGVGVHVIDIEGDWRFTHIDLQTNNGGHVGGTLFNDFGWRNHGTAVLGELGGSDNNFGVIGICPEAKRSAVSHKDIGSANAIRHAATLLQRGDVLLLEMHRPGPRFNFQTRSDQRGYIAVEWWPDDLLAIQFASARGVIVVEAAGNGAESLDDPLYDTPDVGFPGTWRNPFRGAVDSHAVLVGAGAPPPDAHNVDHGPDRSRLEFSNYGSRVDCQGWGREVTTTGYGDLFGAQMNEDFWFTDRFSGTSSASPIVTGVVAVMQGIAKRNGSLLSPQQLRTLLRSHGSGSPQTNAPGRPATQRIGLRPDLRKLIPAMQAVA